MAKYIECRIQFDDDKSELDVIIKDNDEIDQYDEDIFFYGYSEQELREGCEKGYVFEGDWRVISVNGVYDAMP